MEHRPDHSRASGGPLLRVGRPPATPIGRHPVRNPFGDPLQSTGEEHQPEAQSHGYFDQV